MSKLPAAATAAMLSFAVGAMDVSKISEDTEAKATADGICYEISANGIGVNKIGFVCAKLSESSVSPSEDGILLRSRVCINGRQFILTFVTGPFRGETRKVFFPASAEVIDKGCFKYCVNLGEAAFEIDSRMREMRDSAFLKSGPEFMRVPAATEIIGRKCFNDSVNLRSIVFETGSKLREIGSAAFSVFANRQNGLVSVSIPASVEILGDRCFSGLKDLCEITFEPESKLRKIGRRAFMLTSPEEICIPTAVDISDPSCFALCRKLCRITFPQNENDSRSLRIPNGIAKLGECCFFGTRLQSVYVSADVETIDEACFKDCPLEEIIFDPNSRLREIRSNAFSGVKLRTIRIPASTEILGRQCFHKCARLEEVIFERNAGLRKIEEEAFRETGLKSVYIPSSVKILDRGCFRNCRQLSAITFDPESELSEIGSQAFFETALTPTVNENGSAYHLFGGGKAAAALVKDGKINSPVQFPFGGGLLYEIITLERCPGAKGAIRIPSSVTVIGVGCFEDCGDLREILFEPDSRLRRIEDGAFRKTGLISAEFPESLESVGLKCFSECPRLNRIKFGGCEYDLRSPRKSPLPISSGTERIYPGLLSGVTTLRSVYIPAEVVDLGDNCFYGCKGISKVIFARNSRLRRIGKRAFDGSGLRKIRIPASVELLDEESFSRCKYLQKLTFESESRLQKFGSGVFTDKDVTAPSRLKSICIPRSVEIIGAGCFENCECLFELLFEEGSRLRRIEDYAFGNAFSPDANVKISIPASVNYIGAGCFMSNTFQRVTFEAESQLRKIKRETFHSDSLSEIRIPASVEILGEACFGECEDLLKIVFESGSALSKIDVDAFNYCYSIELAVILSDSSLPNGGISERLRKILRDALPPECRIEERAADTEKDVET
jgi:hypothetical protein